MIFSGNSNLSLVTLGSTEDPGFWKTIHSVLDSSLSLLRWVFVVYTNYQKKYLIDFLDNQCLLPEMYGVLVCSSGISSSMNKGINFLINHDCFVLFLHGGDTLALPLEIDPPLDPAFDLHFYGVTIVSSNGSARNSIFTSPAWHNKIHSKPCVLHQGVFASISLFKKYGLFDLRYRSIMDYAWFYSLSEDVSKGIISCAYHSQVFSVFRLGGASSNILSSSIEHFRLLRDYGYSFAYSFSFSLWIYIAKHLYTVRSFCLR